MYAAQHHRNRPLPMRRGGLRRENTAQPNKQEDLRGGVPEANHFFDGDNFFRTHQPFGSQFGTGHRPFTSSNPRLFPNDDEFFNKPFHGGMFPHEHSSFFRRPPSFDPMPTNRADRGVEIPVHIQRQGQQPCSATANNQGGKSPGGGFSAGNFPSEARFPQDRMQQPVHLRQRSADSSLGGGGGAGLVEINNANLGSYTHGELNPDKRMRFSHLASAPRPNGPPPHQPAQQQQEVPVVVVDDYSAMKVCSPRGGVHISPAISHEAIPLPAPPTNSTAADEQILEMDAAATVMVEESQDRGVLPVITVGTVEATRRQLKQMQPVALCSEQLIGLLDETERRVEQLREAAGQLEHEKETILDMLNNLKLNTDTSKLTKGDEDELNMNAERIKKRCLTVEVSINTPRNEQQARALDAVNQLINSVCLKMREDLGAAKQTIQGYFNACSPEDDGPIDEKFQRMIVECTADDQKKVRRRLTKLLVSQPTQIRLTEQNCNKEA